MVKDIFIDNNISQYLVNPEDANFSDLVKWLYTFTKNSPDNAYLVVSQKIVTEYLSGSGHTSQKNAIASIYRQLEIEGRLVSISNPELKKFMETHFDEKYWKKLACKKRGSDDPYHIAAICLSNRKIAITEDINLTYDLNNNLPRIKGLVVQVSDNPANLPYK